MLYARYSLNYELSIRVVRRLSLAVAFPLRRRRSLRKWRVLREHLDNAERIGLRDYLSLDTFTNHNTDGPLNPFARVYSPVEVRQDFPDFVLTAWRKRYMHAPPLPVHRLRFLERALGWHLWVWLEARP